MENMNIIMDRVYEIILEFGPKVIGALITLILGLWIISIITKAIRKQFEKRDMDPSLRGFMNSLIGITLKLMLFVSVISMVGIQMTSVIAVLGAAGLAIGMALSGTLQNFAGGVIILILRPFKVGDFVEAQGYSGSISEIQIFNTIMKTPDNKTIIIPNGGLATGSMINYSTESKRRVDFLFGIGYGEDTGKAKTILDELVIADNRILKEPAHFIAISELADSSVNIVVRAWVNSPDYWKVYFDMTENVYKAFNKEGINIPYPQMDVHLHK